MKKNILVFPCGSEVALEIHKSLRFSAHFNLIGASSINDHGRFVFQDYVDAVPYYNASEFIEYLQNVVKMRDIDAIYPAMDAVALILKENEENLGCKVIGSSYQATKTASSKNKTYQLLSPVISCPKWENDIDSVKKYPVFLKPDEGYGSRNIKLAYSELDAKEFLKDKDLDYVFCEYLPGKEYTIDCFTDRNGKLLFSGPRERIRVSNGISVSTQKAKEHNKYFAEIAKKINNTLLPRGAWFFQMKENSQGKPTLLEVATRLGGSSSYFRAIGVNFAILSVFDVFDHDVSVHTNSYGVIFDRTLSNKYKIDIKYKTVYVDFDDCIFIDNKVNTQLIQFLYQSINRRKTIILITRHTGQIYERLKDLRIDAIFDKVIHLNNKELKSDFIRKESLPIFIDDSYGERLDVSSKLQIPVFSPDMVEVLLD